MESTLEQLEVSSQHALYDDWNTTLCPIDTHLPPLIQVGRLSLTYRDGLRASIPGTENQEKVVRLKLIVC